MQPPGYRGQKNKMPCEQAREGNGCKRLSSPTDRGLKGCLLASGWLVHVHKQPGQEAAWETRKRQDAENAPNSDS